MTRASVVELFILFCLILAVISDDMVSTVGLGALLIANAIHRHGEDRP